ncbi:hypothetical protein PENSTE_c011G04901 [Penicillium steckii]|uniref:Terpene synthase n=1 Tax=Penicillium steckii TaxID=303698 RepID=A0A1V6T7B2_9EURO|nr:hypothetical protein PENSTE_c011G04901 [Penicillium steckii]
MAKGTALVITADSDFLPPHVKKSLPHSQMRIWQGLEPLDEWSSRFFGHIREAAELFGSNDPALGTLSASGWMRHIDGWCLENKISDITTTIQSPCSSSAGSERSSQTDLSLFKACPVEDFPYYLRSITGTQIPYFVAIFKPTRGIEAPYPIWMSYVPALTTMINLGNDLLSFPKEVLAGETANYISLVTQMKRDAGYKSKFANDSLWTMRDSIQELFMRLVDSIRALDDGFADLLLRDCYCRSTEHKLLSQERRSRWSKSQVQLTATLWALFKQGYFAWHINSKRYGLDSLKSHFEGA